MVLTKCPGIITYKSTLGTPSSKSFKTFLHRIIVNKLSELKIKCDFEKRGCPEVVALHSLEAHLQECHFRNICDKCSERSQEFIEQLIRSNEESKNEIKRLEKERANYLETIQEMSAQLDAIDPLQGVSNGHFDHGHPLNIIFQLIAGRQTCVQRVAANNLWFRGQSTLNNT